MSYIAIAFFSIGLVLLNVAIGCVLASKGMRDQLSSTVRRILRPRRSPGK